MACRIRKVHKHNSVLSVSSALITDHCGTNSHELEIMEIHISQLYFIQSSFFLGAYVSSASFLVKAKAILASGHTNRMPYNEVSSHRCSLLLGESP